MSTTTSGDHSDSPPGLLSGGLSAPDQQRLNADADEITPFVTVNDSDTLSNEASNQVSTYLSLLLVGS